jgi:hypothetical protein
MNLVQMKVNQFKHHQKKHEQVQIKKHPNHPVKNMYENYDQENKKKKKMMKISVYVKYLFILAALLLYCQGQFYDQFICVYVFVHRSLYSFVSDAFS